MASHQLSSVVGVFFVFLSRIENTRSGDTHSPCAPSAPGSMTIDRLKGLICVPGGEDDGGLSWCTQSERERETPSCFPFTAPARSVCKEYLISRPPPPLVLLCSRKAPPAHDMVSVSTVRTDDDDDPFWSNINRSPIGQECGRGYVSNSFVILQPL